MDPEQESFVKTALTEMKKMADEAQYNREHPTPPPTKEEKEKARAKEKAELDKVYNSYSERINKRGPRDVKRKCFKDYSTICPSGFVAV